MTFKEIVERIKNSDEKELWLDKNALLNACKYIKPVKISNHTLYNGPAITVVYEVDGLEELLHIDYYDEDEGEVYCYLKKQFLDESDGIYAVNKVDKEILNTVYESPIKEEMIEENEEKINNEKINNEKINNEKINNEKINDELYLTTADPFTEEERKYHSYKYLCDQYNEKSKELLKLMLDLTGVEDIENLVIIMEGLKGYGNNIYDTLCALKDEAENSKG